jgi:hypothetical protein
MSTVNRSVHPYDVQPAVGEYRMYMGALAHLHFAAFG